MARPANPANPPCPRCGSVATVGKGHMHGRPRWFCGGCTRARLSAEGKLFTCLFAVAGHDLRALLRGGASDAETSAAIGGIWRMREDRYSELRTAATAGLPKVEMSYIGG